MKKPIFIVILLVLMLAGMGPVGFGFWADSQMNRMMEEMSDSEVLDFTIIKQKRGWLSSTYDIAVELTDEASSVFRGYQQANLQSNSEDGIQPLNIIIRNVVCHGPFPYKGFTKGNFSFVPVIAMIETEVIGISSSKDTDKSLDLPMPYSIRSLVSLTGTIVSVINIKPWSGIPAGGKAQIDWQGLNAEFKYSTIKDNLKSIIRVPLFTASNPDEDIMVSDILVEIEVREGFRSLGIGEMRFHLGEVKLDNLNDSGRKFSMKNLDFTVSSDVSDGSLNSVMELNVESIQSGDKHFGPGAYQLKLSNLDAEALKKIDQQVTELKRQGVSQEQMGIMMTANMLSILPDFLAKGPRLEITNLSLDGDYGRMEGSGKIYFDTSNKAALLNPALLKEAIIAELEFSIPEELLILMAISKMKNEIAGLEATDSEEQIEFDARAQVKNQMERLVQQNIFVRSGKNYSISASFMNGQMTVNGSELNLLPFSGEAVRQMESQAGQNATRPPLGQLLQP